MEIILLPINKIKPYSKNPRKNDNAVEYVANRIKEFGFKQPLVIDKNNVIIAGHTRYKAAIKLGYDLVPCVKADDLTSEQIKAYRLADNKTHELSEWDIDLLNDELVGIFDLDMANFGFLDEPEKLEAQEDDFDIDEALQKEPITKRGDLYKLGEHRLLCGDATNIKDVERLMNWLKADMVFTDPPYGVSIGDKNKMLQSVQKAGRIVDNIENDTLNIDDLYNILLNAFKNIRDYSNDSASYYVTSPQGGGLGMMMIMMMKDAGLEVRHVLMWVKNSPTFSMGRLDYEYQHEPILYTWTKKHNWYGKGQFKTSIWKIDKPRKCDLHPTMKPIELIANALNNSSKVCEQLNRKCYMMELDPKYCDVIIERWEKITDKKAELI